jgi:hypothetical protein
MNIRSSFVRGMLSLGLLATFTGLPAAAEPPAYAAGARDPRDPDARLQVIIKSIHLLGQYDTFNEGDFEFDLTFSQIIPDCADMPTQASTCEFIAGTGRFTFSGDKDDTITLDKYLPDLNGGGYAANGSVGPGLGLPVWADKAYRLELVGTESDSGLAGDDDDAGTLVWDLSAANGWDLGARTERAVKHSSYYGTDGWKVANTEVEYEIRRMPLPDLIARNLQVTNTPELSTSHQLCTQIENAGPLAAAAFQVVFMLDGKVLPDALGTVSQGLGAGAAATACANTQLPSQGQHKLLAMIDDARAIAEMNELNNWVEETYAVAAPTPTPTPRVPAQPDLSITSIKVADAELTQYCTPGKNDITITVKNGGSQPAGPSVVRLEVDDDSDDKRIQSVDAGKSLDVTFENVKLKDDEHRLRGTADAKDSVDEANEDNNTKTISVTCKEE